MDMNSQYPIIVTDNIEKSMDFYTNALGYSVKHKAVTKNNSNVYVLSNGKYEFDLVQKTGDMNTGLCGLRMNVKDIDAALKEIQNAGLKIIFGPVRTNNGVNLIFEDINGVQITLVQHI